jgi:hypothetical protein
MMDHGIATFLHNHPEAPLNSGADDWRAFRRARLETPDKEAAKTPKIFEGENEYQEG